jgi:regulator of replication initiation timing
VRVAKLGFQIRVIITGVRSLEAFSRSQVSEMKSLKKENERLKKIVADLQLDKVILKESLDHLKPQGLTRAQLRQAVIHTRQKLDISERRACAVLDVARSSLRYQAKLSR